MGQGILATGGCGLCSPTDTYVHAASFREEQICGINGQQYGEENVRNGSKGSNTSRMESISPRPVALLTSEEEDEERRRMMAVGKKGKRTSVSAEAVDESAIKNYRCPFYSKPDSAKRRIADTLRSNEKMQLLGIDRFGQMQLDEMVGAFQEKVIPKDHDVIRQGDNGDCLYIIDEGSFDIFVARSNEDGRPGPSVKVATFGPGALFGELALMYQAPRAATVRCTTPNAAVWSLAREPFQMLLKRCGVQAVEQYSGWLTRVEIFGVLNKHEISKIADACESVLFDEGENIISQGEDGDAFYILEEGMCGVFIGTPEEPSGEKQVLIYDRQGDYFGELALLNNEPRKATVRAISDASCIKIDKENFLNLLGPINDRLKAQASQYPKYASALR